MISDRSRLVRTVSVTIVMILTLCRAGNCVGIVYLEQQNRHPPVIWICLCLCTLNLSLGEISRTIPN